MRALDQQSEDSPSHKRNAVETNLDKLFPGLIFAEPDSAKSLLKLLEVLSNPGGNLGIGNEFEFTARSIPDYRTPPGSDDHC